MFLHNTLSGKKEELEAGKGKIKMFVCGPTVYDYSHIGHAKNYLTFDIVVRYLRSIGYKIFYLQNITDIDDKIIKRANESKEDPVKLADQFTRAYFEDMKALGIKTVNKYARATKFIKQIVSQVKKLVDKGYAYKAEDGYYFDISKFKDYGKLSHRTAEQAEDSVSRIDESAGKRNKGDFCLWKFYKEGEPYWTTSLGKGRPGWHIEDTAITEKFFGPQYDIHGGGLDLKFPHHEAELAQQEAASGLKPFVKIWMHSGLLYINGVKMSKSLGNFITVRDLLKECPAEIFRYIILMHHYRSPINYTGSLVLQARQSLGAIREFVGRLNFVKSKHRGLKIGPKGDDVSALLEEIEVRFKKSMEDDFNTPRALASIFEMMAMLQVKVWGMSAKEAAGVSKFIKDKFAVFGIKVAVERIPVNVSKIARARQKSRVNKQFMQSDALRKEIESLGYRVEDTPLGQLVLKAES